MKNLQSKAEIKDRKFRERLTGNADANPEPSREESEGAETRHDQCLKCGGTIPSTRYKNAKYCSIKCRNAYISYKWRVKKGLIVKPGVGSGGNQLGENNHRYKNGIGIYSKKAFEFYGKVCNRCNSKNRLLVHHKDENRSNNELSNLEILCKKCHQDHHCLRDNLGRYSKH